MRCRLAFVAVLGTKFRMEIGPLRILIENRNLSRVQKKLGVAGNCTFAHQLHCCADVMCQLGWANAICSIAATAAAQMLCHCSLLHHCHCCCHLWLLCCFALFLCFPHLAHSRKIFCLASSICILCLSDSGNLLVFSMLAVKNQ